MITLTQINEAIAEFNSHSFLSTNFIENLEHEWLDTGIEIEEVVEDFDYYF